MRVNGKNTSSKPDDSAPMVEDVTSADYYFDSYAHFGIHEEMLKDEVRTKSYMNAIMQNPHLFKDKVVLDVGCGTGILSMFAAKAGAKLVIGVDMSNIIHQAREIVKTNGFEGKVQLLQGKMEELTLPVDKVDIIVSEWMGYCLLYESMLDTVLYARDKYLAEGGIVMPDKAIMHICGIEDAEYREEKLEFWNDVYGFDMTCIKKIAMTEPLVDTVEAQQICTKTCQLKSLDLQTCTKDDLQFTVPYRIQASRNDYIHALVVSFDCGFTKGHKEVWLPTGPRAKYTHWRQTVFYLGEILTARQGEVVEGEFTLKCNERNHRDLDLRISVNFEGENHGRTQAAYDFRLR